MRTSRTQTRVTIASRLFIPEPAAASFRLDAATRALVRDRARVRVLTTKYAPRSYEARGTHRAGQAENPRISRWPVLRDRAGYIRGYLPYLSFDLPLFFRLLFGARPEVVLVEPPPTTGLVVKFACAIRRVPYVWYAADVWSDATRATGAPRIVSALVESAERSVLRGASGVIAVSDGVAQRVRTLGGRNVKTIPNGVDTDVYRLSHAPLESKSVARDQISGRYLIYAGTASEWQGAEIFAEALEGLLESESDLQLVYLGQGSRWEKIGSLSASINQRLNRTAILQIDQQSPEDVARLLQKAEFSLVSLVPGKGYDFAYPTKTLASLACGTPVIFSGTGPAARDIVECDLGYVADYTSESIATTVDYALRAGRDVFDRQSLRNWVKGNGSLERTGALVSSFVLGSVVGHPNTERYTDSSD